MYECVWVQVCSLVHCFMENGNVLWRAVVLFLYYLIHDFQYCLPIMGRFAKFKGGFLRLGCRGIHVLRCLFYLPVRLSDVPASLP